MMTMMIGILTIMGFQLIASPKNALWDLFEVAESPALPLGPFRPKPPLVKTKGLRVEVSERRLEGPNNSHTKYSCQAFWLCNSFSAFA